jgi:ABC-2 type transport system permease protein
MEVVPELWPIGLFMLGAGIVALMRYRQTLD